MTRGDGLWAASVRTAQQTAKPDARVLATHRMRLDMGDSYGDGDNVPASGGVGASQVGRRAEVSSPRSDWRVRVSQQVADRALHVDSGGVDQRERWYGPSRNSNGSSVPPRTMA